MPANRSLKDVTLTGAFLGTRAYVRHVRAREGGGVLINISSGAAVKAYEGWGAYCAAKAGLLHLTNCVAQEERDSGLRAYSVAPGIVDTGMQALIRAFTPEQFPQLERFKALKRDDAFNSPGFVAEHLLGVAFDPDYPTAEPAESVESVEPADRRYGSYLAELADPLTLPDRLIRVPNER